MTIIKQYNTDTSQWEAIAVGQKGDTGEGVAAGGTTDQILTKASNTDFDTQWVSSISIDTATLDKAIWNIPATPYPDALAGELQWNLDLGTLDLGLDGNVVLPIGQASFYYVKNQTGSDIAKGTLVMAVGTLGDSGRILAAPWDGNSPAQTIMGITNELIANGGDGYVVHFGEIRQINATGTPYTETWQDFDILYAGPNGGITNVPPQAPETKTIVALVVHAVENGAIFVRPTFSPSIANDDLVEITNIADNDILRYNSANNRFENESLGSLADQNSDNVSITGGSITGITDLAVADGGTGASDAATARTNLELGTISTQDANTVDIDGGNIDGTAIGVSATSSGSFTTIDGSGDMNIDSGTLFVDVSENRVGIGTTSPSKSLEVAKAEANHQIRLTESSDIGDDTALFYARRSRGTSLSSPAAIQATNNMGGIAFGGYNGTSYAIGSSIRGLASQNWTASAQGSFLSFRTTNDETTSETEKMRIDSNGNVGIGTASPNLGGAGSGTVLHINDSIESQIHLTNDTTGATTTDGTNISVFGSDLYINNRESGSTTFYTANQERMRITSSGNVGVGNTSPDTLLDLLVGAGSAAEIRALRSAGRSVHAYADLTNAIFAYNTGELRIGETTSTVASNFTERMRIDSSGNVLIGATQTNGYKFEVTATTDAAQFISNSAGAFGAQIQLFHDSESPTVNDATGLINFAGRESAGNATIYSRISGISTNITDGSESGAIAFGTRNLGSFAERMRIASNGSVGIGTTSPSSLLEVYHIGQPPVVNSLFASMRLNTDSTSNWQRIRFDVDSTPYWGIGRQSTTNNFVLSGRIGSTWSDSVFVVDQTNGYVGIGESSPAQKLHVTGGTNEWAIFERSSKQLYLNPNYSDLNSYAQVAPKGTDGMSLSLSSKDTNPEYLFITNSGNVGVGTISPNENFDVNGEARFRQTGGNGGGPIEISDRTGGNSQGIQWNIYYDGSNWRYRNSDYGASISFAVNGDLIYYNHALGTAGGEATFREKLRIKESGNVGIGTSDPITTLDVRNSATADPFVQGYFRNDLSSGNAYGGILVSGQRQAHVRFLTGSATWNGSGARQWQFRVPVDLDQMRIYSWTHGNDIMTWDNNGRVGVGTNSPSNKLHIVDNGFMLRLEQSTDSTEYLALSGNQIASYLGGGAGPLYLNVSNGGGEVRIRGTTDRGAYNLQVNGTGVWGAGAYVNGSDQNLKENIEEISSSLDIVMKMRPVSFTYKEDYSKDRNVQAGFIAQELQEIMQNEKYVDGIVQSGPEYLNVAYQSLIPILTKAIQELKAELDELKGTQ